MQLAAITSACQQEGPIQWRSADDKGSISSAGIAIKACWQDIQRLQLGWRCIGRWSSHLYGNEQSPSQRYCVGVTQAAASLYRCAE